MTTENGNDMATKFSRLEDREKRLARNVRWAMETSTRLNYREPVHRTLCALSAIAWRNDPKGRVARAAIADIADFAGIGRESVRNAIRVLKRDGLILSCGATSQRGNHQGDVYGLTVPPGYRHPDEMTAPKLVRHTR